MKGVSSLPSQRQPAIVSHLDKWRPSIAIRPDKTPEEAFRETYQAAKDQFNNAITAAAPHNHVDDATFKHRRDLVFDCTVRLKEIEEQHEATREEQQRDYEKGFGDREDLYVFELFDVLGRERVDDLTTRWRERCGQCLAASTQPATSTIGANAQPNITSQANGSTLSNNSQQPNTSAEPDTASGSGAASRQTASAYQDTSLQQATAPQPYASPCHAQTQSTDQTTPSFFTPINGLAREATRPSAQASTNAPTPDQSEDQRDTEQSNKSNPSGFQCEGVLHSGFDPTQKDLIPTTSHKRQPSSSTPNAPGSKKSKKQATPCAPGEHTQGRTIEFDEVYQNGNAEAKRIIVKYFQDWYIVECKEHKMPFLKQTLKAASKHLSSGKHRMENPGQAGVIRELGTHVLNCTEERAMMNNEVAERQSYDQIGLPDSRVSSNDAPPVIHSLYTRSSQGIFGIDPKPGEVYTAYWKRGKKWYAALILPWGSFGRFGWNMSLQSTELIRVVPKCYLFDPHNPQVTPEWAEGYRPNGPLYSKREYPVMYFDRSVFPGKYSMAWVAAADLQHYDPQAKHIPFRDVVDKFILDQRMVVRSGVEMGQDVLPEHDNTTDSLYVPTPPESSDDQPNAQTEQPEPHNAGMSWEQGIVISDCESEPDENADVQDEQCPRKVSESLQPTLINVPYYPVTRNETPQQPQVPMHDGPAKHPTNDHNNTSVTATRTRLEQAITQYALAGPDGRDWPPSVDEMMNTEEDLELWTRARHPITGDLVFNPHGTKGNADQVPNNMHSGFMSQVPI
ncbi:uncharacterized protein QYS62_009717 [Fusarium acuminatum]|uniref:Uncharacterized protein n=1 Tax=Fusarium acuminatum TaxID=5515 RepID=A0ABZ2X9Q6_9HYPO